MILVTGSSGFIGSNLTGRMKQLGMEFSCLQRQGSTENHYGCSVVTSDLSDLGKLRNDLNHIHFSKVVHLAGTPNATRKQSAIDVQITKNILWLCKERKAQRIVFSSSYLADGYYASAYGSGKGECEILIMNSGINYSILRISTVYGKGDRRNIASLISKIKKSNFVAMSSRLSTQPVLVDDVVEAIIRSLEMNKNGIFNIAGDEVLTMKSLIAGISKSAGRNPLMINVPLPLLYPAAFLAETVKLKPPITVEQISNMRKFRKIDNSMAKKDLGIRFTKMADGLR
jgi:dihydroflavonol-4-reductase